MLMPATHFLSRWLCGVLLVASGSAAAELPDARKIDDILERHWQKQGLTPQEPATDEVFLRRVYVDVAGRIPTLEEATRFLQSPDPQKRARLIDELLASPAYASHYFHFFADLLRLLTDARDGVTGKAYAGWLKQALLENRPYDELVRELLTTEGGAWDSGAIGFYMRDRGMPLDHLAATVQVFLGTRIECAQCHNHPFDRWTQRDYYQMAAFTYGMDTRVNYNLNRGEFRKKGLDDSMRESLQRVKKSLGEVTKPLRYTSIEENEKPLKLPHDYQYDDGKPGDAVMPVAMFGHAVDLAPGDSRVEAFADWMTSPANPRFTTVIANRLWKKVMGAGVIEPVDEMTDSTVPVNAELMSHLEQVMVRQDYDLKAYLRVLLNSGVYQRMPATQGLALGETYHFPGPLLRRLSAEQLWDSIVTLLHGNLDAEITEPDARNEAQLASLQKLHQALTEKSGMELIESVRQFGAGEDQQNTERQILELTRAASEARKAGDADRARQLSAQVNRLRNQTRQSAFVAILGEEGAESYREDRKTIGKKGKSGKKAMAMPAEMKAQMREQARAMMAQGMSPAEVRKELQEENKQQRRESLMMSQAVRASELESPAPRGHFLRTFGQSDRETIDNANREAAVPQALNLMNGPVAAALLKPGTAFQCQLDAIARPEDQLASIYLALLSRRPTHNERHLLSQVLKERGDQAVEDVVHALLNTGEFLYVR